MDLHAITNRGGLTMQPQKHTQEEPTGTVQGDVLTDICPDQPS